MTEKSSPDEYDQRSHLRVRMTEALIEVAFVAPQLEAEDYSTIAEKFEEEELETIRSAGEQLTGPREE
jgi:hypothetical protein